jgi:hypothetical protein
MHQQVDAHSPIPIRWQLTELRKDVSEGGSVPRNQALPSPRKLVGFLGIHPNARARPSRSSNGVGTGRSPLDGCGALVHLSAARAQGATGRPCVAKSLPKKGGWDQMPGQDTADLR